MPTNDPTSPQGVDEFDPHRIFVQTGLALGITSTVLIVLMLIFRSQIQSFGEWFIHRFGWWGFFGLSYFTDALIVPGSIDIAFPLLAQKGLNPVPVLALMCLGSILGGTTGWAIGHFFDHIQLVHRMVEYYRSKGEHLIKRYGFWAVVIASVSPVPYSTVSWIAGLMKVPFLTYTAASLFRIPRIVIMYLFITQVVFFHFGS